MIQLVAMMCPSIQPEDGLFVKMQIKVNSIVTEAGSTQNGGHPLIWYSVVDKCRQIAYSELCM